VETPASPAFRLAKKGTLCGYRISREANFNRTSSMRPVRLASQIPPPVRAIIVFSSMSGTDSNVPTRSGTAPLKRTWLGLLAAPAIWAVGHCQGLVVRGPHLTLVISGLVGNATVTLRDGWSTVSGGNGSIPIPHIDNSYNLVIIAQPRGQTCTVENGTGTMAETPLKPINVKCSGGYSVGGTVSGLSPGERISVINNSADFLSLASNGQFRFTKLLMPGQEYGVGIDLQPERKKCLIDHAEGTLRTADVTDIKIVCAPDPLRDGLFVGVEDSDLVNVPSSIADSKDAKAHKDEQGDQCPVQGKRVPLRPGVEIWFLTETCGGSGGQPFYLTVGTATKGKTVLSAFGSGLTILHTQTNGMSDLTVWHGGRDLELETFRFDGKQYKSADDAGAPAH
jgi:hypothetical protein